MSGIPLDVVLRHDQAENVLAAVGALASQRRLSGSGVSQSRDRIRQFRFAVDEANQWWSIVFEDDERYEYRDGVYSYLGRGGNESRPEDFFSQMPQELQMIWPTKLLTWGSPSGSFYPVLAQHVGQHSILFTFEHDHDPAFRQTLVLDERSGIAKRMVGFDHGLVITRIQPLGEWEPQPVFEPIAGPIPTDY